MISLGVTGSVGSTTSKDLSYAGTSLALNFIKDYTKISKYQDPTKISGYAFSRASGGYAETVTGTTRFFPEMRTNLLTYSEEFNNAVWTKTNSYIQTNLLLNSEQLTNAPWTKSSMTVTANAITAPDGNVTAEKFVPQSLSTEHYARQNINITTGSTFTASIYVKAAGLTTFRIRCLDSAIPANGFGGTVDTSTGAALGFGAGIGTVAQVSATNVGNDWYRLIVSGNAGPTCAAIIYDIFILQDGPYSATTFAGNDVDGGYFWGAQLVQGSTAGDYQQTLAAAAAVQYTDPNGNLTADKLVEDTANTTHYAQQVLNFVIGTAYTFSFYAKAAERSKVVAFLGVGAFSSVPRISFNLTGSGSVTINNGSPTGTITALANGWYRCSMKDTCTTSAAASTRILIDSAAAYLGDGISGVYIWGAQIEPVTNPACTYPMDYIPTTTTAAVNVSGGYGVANGSLMWFPGTRTNLMFPADATTGWSASPGSSVVATANAATSPDETINATKLATNDTATSAHIWFKTYAGAINTAYCGSVYLKAGEYSRAQVSFGNTAFTSVTTGALFDLATGTVVITSGGSTATITPAGNGWYRCSVTATSDADGGNYVFGASLKPASVTTIDELYTPASTGLGGYVYGVQVETTADTRITYPTAYIPTTTATASAGTPRITAKGYLAEESRTNLLLYSEQLDNAAWGKGNTTVTADAIVSPDGTTDADAIIETLQTSPATAYHYIYQTITKAAVSTQYTITVYAKAKDSRQLAISFASGSSGVAGRVDLTTGTVVGTGGAYGTGWTFGSLTMAAVGNGWYKITLVATSDALSTASLQFSLHDGTTNVYTGDGVSGVYLWGTQIEASNFATSYIPTTSAATTRAADNLTYSLGSWYNQNEGTFLLTVEASPNANAEYLEIYDVSNASNSFYFDNAGGSMRNIVASGGSVVSILNLGATGTVGVTNKLAGAYALNNFAASRNGGTVITDTLGVVPVGPLQMTIGRSVNAVPSTYIDGYIKSIYYYNTRLSNAKLQELTL